MPIMPAIAFGATQIIVSLIVYVYIGACLMVIGNKQGRTDGWMGFIPIVNIWYMCVLGDKPGWWVILAFIPLVNIVIGILIWWAIAEKQGKPGWVSILMLVPFLGVLVPGYIAFA